MRVALVCGELRPELDGVGAYAVRLARELTAAGIEVSILHPGRFRLGRAGTPARSVRNRPARWSLGSLIRAARLLRGADVVHVQFAPSMYRFSGAIGLLPLLLRAPLVTTLHEYGWWAWARLPDAAWRLAERRLLVDRETGALVPRSRVAVVTNPAHRAVLEARFGGRVPVRAIPIGANVSAGDRDPAAARAAGRRELLLESGTTVIAFFGFVHPVKGVRYLIEAVAALRDAGRDVHLLVVGGFESLALPAGEAAAFEAELRGVADRAGVAVSVTFTGFREPDAASRLLHAADLAALPFTAGVTTKSGSLLTVLSHGLPTLVTDGRDPELVDGATCVLVPSVRDTGALVAGLTRLLDDGELRARVAAGGTALAASRDWSAIARQHLEVYRAAGGRGRP